MEVKKKFFNRIGAFVCALVVLVGCLGGTTNYFGAEIDWNAVRETFYGTGSYVVNAEDKGFTVSIDENKLVQYPYVAVAYSETKRAHLHYIYSTAPLVATLHSGSTYSAYIREPNGAYSLTCSTCNSSFELRRFFSDGRVDYCYNHGIVYSNHDINWWDGQLLYLSDETVVDVDLGYLQDVRLTNAYTSGVLGNYDNDSLTRKWRYSQYTTTDIDLCDGNYSVRHYIKPVGVSGYEKEDIKKEFDMYLMGTYDANNLHFQYAQKDYDTIMASQGYDGLGFSEMYLKGWFILYHHYFQIVNNDTGTVGGYVHIYPYDAKGENFGVEYVGETLDKDMNLDENGYSGVVNESEIGTGETIEDAFENAKPESEKGIDFTGVEEFASVLESYVGQVSNVTQGIGALFNSLPPWLLVTLAIGISLTVFLGVIKIIRG